MVLTVETPRLSLAEGEFLRLDDARGLRIQPAGGPLWITEEGEPRDFVVAAGETFVISRDGRTLVQAMGPALVDLRPRAGA